MSQKPIDKIFDGISEIEEYMDRLRDELKDPYWTNENSKILCEAFESLRKIQKNLVRLPDKGLK